MDLSIIIPVYNTAGHDLLRCFDSLESMEGITYEVIVVDDGSEEETAGCCREYARTHGAFRYVRQENQGVSAARNKGLELAKGNYVLFVDADDEMRSCNLEKQALNTDAQVILFDMEIQEWGRCKKWPLFDRDVGAIPEKREVVAAICANRMNSACAKLYRRGFLAELGIFFDTSMSFAEDAMFALQLLPAAEKIRYEPKILYRYHHRFQSGKDRLARLPDRVVQNSIMLYERRLAMLKRPDIAALFTPEEYRALEITVHQRVVADLFEAEGSLRIMGLMDQRVFGKIHPLTERLYENYGREFDRKDYWKCRLLAKNRCVAVLALACLREIYIRFRR